MRDDALESASGFLLDNKEGLPFERHHVQGEHIEYRSCVGSSRWEHFVFESDEPLLQEENRERAARFRYTLYCRRSGRHMALLSEDRKIVEHLLHRRAAHWATPAWERLAIAVDALVRFLVNNPQQYVLNFVHARVPAFGSSLKAISFYGEDIGEARLFREQLSLLNCYTCGVRDVVQGIELIRLGSDGAISVPWPSEQRFNEVEKVLTFLRTHGFIP